MYSPSVSASCPGIVALTGIPRMASSVGTINMKSGWILACLLAHGLCLTTEEHGDLALSINPSSFEEGCSTDVTLVCNVSAPKHSYGGGLVSLVLQKFNNNLDLDSVQDIVTLSRISDPQLTQFHNLSGRVDRVSGHIEADGRAFLVVKMSCPTRDLAGSYLCEANSISASGHPMQNTVMARLGFTPITPTPAASESCCHRVDGLAKQLEMQSGAIADLNQTVRQQADAIRSLECSNERLTTNIAKDLWGFTKLNITIDGWVIYSSEKTYYTLTETQAKCALIGGKLLELEQDRLNQLVHSDLKRNVHFLTGIVQREGHWVFLTTGQSAGPINWGDPLSAGTCSSFVVLRGTNEPSLHSGSCPFFKFLCMAPQDARSGQNCTVQDNA